MNSCFEKWLFPDKLEIADGSSIFKKDENLKGIAMQIEKALIKIAYEFLKHPENFAFLLLIILQ